MNRNKLELVEYSWDEKTEVSSFVYENDDETKRETVDRLQVFKASEPTPELYQSYFANLQFWLKTQQECRL